MDGDKIDLNDEEKKAIRALKRVAKKWPKSLWLFLGIRKSVCNEKRT